MIDWEVSIPSAKERHPNHFEPAPRAAAVDCWLIPREEWPPGWFPTKGYARFQELKAQEAEDNAAALADELGATSDALTESRAAGEDVKSENRSLGRQLRASMELAERLQEEQEKLQLNG